MVTKRQLYTGMTIASLLAVALGLLGLELVAAKAAVPPKSVYVDSLRRGGRDVWPAVTPQIILTETGFAGLDGLVPLGGIAHADTLFCREDGDWLAYTSDRYGFHNDDAVWDLPELEVALLGDSFAQGACVPSASNFAGQLRERFPATVNLGSFGNGPLATLATLVEYLPAKKPKRVLWLYVTNDLGVDLGIEKASPVLSQYLMPGFSQNLAARQGEIDAVLKPFLQERLVREVAREARSFGDVLVEHLTLGALRREMRLAQDRKLRPPPPTEPALADYDRARALDRKTFEKALTQARQLVESWGGTLTLVVIPDARMFGGYRETGDGVEPELYVAQLAASVRALGVSVVDLRAALAASPKPLEKYAVMHGYYGHFDEAGYRFAAQALLGKL